MLIRLAVATDDDAIRAIIRPVLHTGETCGLDRDMSRDDALVGNGRTASGRLPVTGQGAVDALVMHRTW